MARFGITHENEQQLKTRHRADGLEVGKLAPLNVKLVELAAGAKLLTIYPINTLEGQIGYGKPKYEQIKRLEVELDSIPEDIVGALENLPAGFVKDPAYGLGLLKAANFFVELIEENSSCEAIRFGLSQGVDIQGDTFQISLEAFGALWQELTRVASRGQRATRRIKQAVTQDALKDALGLQPGRYSGGRHPHARLVEQAAAGINHLTAAETESLVDSLTSGDTLGSVSRVRLKKLRQDVELVNLDYLITNFADMLGQRLGEERWQQFFEENAFALHQVFGAPLVRVHSEAAVGGTSFDGSSGKIADYLVRHSLTNNIALVEIKRPDTKLLASRPYRSGVFPASTELSGALTQVLDQRYHVMQEFLTLKGNARQWELESHSVACFVVAGRLPAADEIEQQKSLSMIRENSKNVVIITYDEVLERMRQLREFLGGPKTFNEPGGHT